MPTTITGTTITASSVVKGSDDIHPLKSDVAKTNVSGTTVEFTGIPSYAKRITVMCSGLSTNGSSNWLLQLGTASSYETSGYLGAGGFYGAAISGTSYTTGFGFQITSSGHVMQGMITLCLLSGATNTWTVNGSFGGTGSGSAYTYTTCGSKSLSATLDRIRFNTLSGLDSFDAGSINIMYE